MNQPSTENTIDYIELPATDIPATQRFYSEAFGWKFEDWGTAYTSFHDGRMAGGFTTATPAPATGILLVIYSKNLAEAQRKITGAGGRITKPTFAFPGGHRFHFADPNGNQLAVWSENE